MFQGLPTSPVTPTGIPLTPSGRLVDVIGELSAAVKGVVTSMRIMSGEISRLQLARDEERRRSERVEAMLLVLLESNNLVVPQEREAAREVPQIATEPERVGMPIVEVVTGWQPRVCSTLQEFIEQDSLLKSNLQLQDELVARFGRLSPAAEGRKAECYQSTMQHLLAMFLTVELQKMFNWSGRQGNKSTGDPKEAICDTATAQIVMRAAVLSHNEFADATCQAAKQKAKKQLRRTINRSNLRANRVQKRRKRPGKPPQLYIHLITPIMMSPKRVYVNVIIFNLGIFSKVTPVYCFLGWLFFIIRLIFVYLTKWPTSLTLHMHGLL